MNEETATNIGVGEHEPQQTAKEAKKRISYVSKDLKTIIEFVAKVYSNLGHTDYHSNKAIATVHGLSPDSIKLHLSSAQQYKLLEIKHGIGYKVTDHFEKIHLFRDEAGKRDAIIESLKHPESYQQLFKDYEYRVVPPEGVKNYFIKLGLKGEVAAKAAQLFLDNLKEYDLLDARGVLTSALRSKVSNSDIKAEDEETNKNDNGSAGFESPQPPPSQLPIRTLMVDADGKKTIPIYLTGNKQALFLYPDDIDEDDIELVKHQIDGILLRIKLESKKKKGAETPS